MGNTIVALSDSHTSTLSKLPAALRQALEDADLIIHAGDHTESSLLDELRQLGDVLAVAGNMDSTALKVQLPRRQLVTFGGRTIGLTHGSGPPWGIAQRVRKMFPEDPDVIVFGHSHVSFTGVLAGVLMVNPGPAHDSYAVIRLGEVMEAEIVPV
ncbi:MAG: YfcE family phosphodiesterase [Chloroflexi bacterium]|nr:YfcE family phosphodiesterase [Chloroflexota bacterium]